MSATCLRLIEDEPAAWLSAPEGLSANAAAIPAAVIWGRLEHWAGHRWGARTVALIVEGPGELVPPVVPFTLETAGCWTGAGWELVTLAEGPLGGLLLPGHATYRLRGQVGAPAASAAVLEAFRRLAEYSAARTAGEVAGASRVSAGVEGAIQIDFNRSPEWLARAVVNSGAADLLRPYRRAA